MARIYIYIIIIVIGSLFLSCGNKNLNHSLPKRSGISHFNYEDNADWMQYTIQEDHFMIYIEVEKPYLIESINNFKVDSIYRVSHIEGNSIYLADVKPNGTIKSFKAVKTAGLGLDGITKKVIQSIKLSPVYYLGKSSSSKALIRISIKGKDRI